MLQRERELQLLDELKRAEVASVVTRGLDPNAPMKDSGIPWIGMIPSHWETKRLSAICSIKSIRNNVNEQLLSVFLGKGVVPFATENSRRTNAITDTTDLSKYQLVDYGDFVLNNQQAWRGSVGISFLRGIISPAYIVLKFDIPLNAQYINYAVQTNYMVAQYYLYSKGIGSIQRNLSWNDLKQASLLLPPLTEQRAIVEYINGKTARIDALIAELRAEIAYLAEYRQRLIADVVTGQICVAEPQKGEME